MPVEYFPETNELIVWSDDYNPPMPAKLVPANDDEEAYDE